MRCHNEATQICTQLSITYQRTFASNFNPIVIKQVDIQNKNHYANDNDLQLNLIFPKKKLVNDNHS